MSVAEGGCTKEILSKCAAWFILDALLYFISSAIYISVFIIVSGICGPTAELCDRRGHSEQSVLDLRKYYIIDEEPFHDQKVGVLCALLGDQIVRVHFLSHHS